MPYINFTDPFITLIALIIFVLLWLLSKETKSNTAPTLELFAYLLFLIAHSVELMVSSEDADLAVLLSKCVAIDEIFIFITFLNLLWADRLQLQKEIKESKGKDKKGKVEKHFDDGLDVMFKNV